jgi:hypothetical protein
MSFETTKSQNSFKSNNFSYLMSSSGYLNSKVIHIFLSSPKIDEIEPNLYVFLTFSLHH